MTFIWPLRSKLTSDHKTNHLIGFLDPENIEKVVSLIILTFLVFLANLIIYFFFRPLGQKRLIFQLGTIFHLIQHVEDTPYTKNLNFNMKTTAPLEFWDFFPGYRIWPGRAHMVFWVVPQKIRVKYFRESKTYMR